MATVSLCMIVKNEEDVLARCLESAAGAVDEIVVVDTGSSDRTAEVAARFTDRIFSFPWTDDFAAARNFAFDQGTMDYLLWLDADDVLLEPDQAALRALKESLDPAVTVVMAPYHVGFDQQGNVTLSYYRERLVKNRAGLRWKGAVHEAIEPAGKILYADFAVTHRKTRPGDPDRNLRIYESQLARGEALDPRAQFYYGRELYDHRRYQEALDVFGAFLDQGQGWMENNIEACRCRARCLDALERPDWALGALLEAFAYDRPRAEVCCELGERFMARGLDRLALYWYALALTCPRDDRRGGFVSPGCYGYIPCLQMCVCYSRLGDQDRAEQMNDWAALFQPESDAVAFNRRYFQRLREDS